MFFAHTHMKLALISHYFWPMTAVLAARPLHLRDVVGIIRRHEHITFITIGRPTVAAT